MRKKELSDDKFDKVRELRETGYSWLKIQKITGIERRLAKRVYNDWLHGRTLNELKQARVNVATQTLSEHVDFLVKLADRLTGQLDLPTSSTEARHSDDVLRDLWEKTILGEFYELPYGERKRRTQRNVRQNLMLFESLRDHTRGKVRWQALDEWKKAWDSCLGLFDKLNIKGQEIATDILNQEDDLSEEIKKRSLQENTIKWMAQVVLDAIWQDIVDGKFDPEVPKVSISYEQVDRRVSGFTEEEWIRRLTSVCHNLAEILIRNQTVLLIRQLNAECHLMRKAIEELEEMLDPLILRSIILLTPRCKLCPA